MTRVLPEPTAEELRATSTTSQKLAEGARRSAEAWRKPFIPPDCVRGFESIFAKEDFDILPEHRQWDHAIELILVRSLSRRKSTLCLQWNKRSWTPFWRKICAPDEFAPQNPPWQLQCSLSRKRMAHSSWFKTIVHSIL